MSMRRKKGGPADQLDVRRENRSKIMMVLNSFGDSFRRDDVMHHPSLNDLNRRQIGRFLTCMVKRGDLIKDEHDKLQVANNGSMKGPFTRNGAPLPNMFFVLNPDTKQIELDVGGLRLPVKIER